MMHMHEAARALTATTSTYDAVHSEAVLNIPNFCCAASCMYTCALLYTMAAAEQVAVSTLAAVTITTVCLDV
jgi:hypothetical protein